MDLELSRAGFAPVRQSLAPDVDQRLVLQLEPQVARPVGKPASRPGAKPTAKAKKRDPNGGHEIFE